MTLPRVHSGSVDTQPRPMQESLDSPQAERNEYFGEGQPSGCRWLPLLEYSVQTGVSLSTLRRYIKSGRIEFRLEDGRYLLPLQGIVNNQEGGQDASPSASSRPTAPVGSRFVASPSDGNQKNWKAEVARLETELRKVREENAELRMLVALYEESLSSSPSRSGNS